MMRRGAVAMIVFAGAWGLAHGQAPADVRAPSNEPRSITLSLNKTGMIEIPQSFRITTSPRNETAGRTVRLQVQSGRSFSTQQQLVTNSRGLAVGTVSSKRAVNRTYRAVLLSARGRVIAASRPVTLTWTPLRHSINLTCSRTTAPVRVSVPCTMAITPAIRLDRMFVLLQVRGRTDWVLVEALRVPPSGVVRSEVMGTQAGSADYRVLLVRDARPVAQSPTFAITYSSAD